MLGISKQSVISQKVVYGLSQRRGKHEAVKSFLIRHHVARLKPTHSSASDDEEESRLVDITSSRSSKDHIAPVHSYLSIY